MSVTESPLGSVADYPQRYTAEPLFAIARDESRRAMLHDPVAGKLPFHGTDYWNAWDMSWLAPTGQPQTAAIQISIPAESVSLVESKSLKLYLGSFAMSEFSSADQVCETIARDLSKCVSAEVSVTARAARQDTAYAPVALQGINLDEQQVECNTWTVNPKLLSADDNTMVEQSVFTHALRSLCPVTAQPDLGSIQIHYRGPQIALDTLLRYIVSYRMHNDFHEACVERIFVDLIERCHCQQLSVYARYQRRGGIDINPFRSNFEDAPANERLWRQ